jgi:hypothetical protein
LKIEYSEVLNRVEEKCQARIDCHDEVMKRLLYQQGCDLSEERLERKKEVRGLWEKISKMEDDFEGLEFDEEDAKNTIIRAHDKEVEQLRKVNVDLKSSKEEIKMLSKIIDKITTWKYEVFLSFISNYLEPFLSSTCQTLYVIKYFDDLGPSQRSQ